MKKNQDQPADAAELRRRAEERLSEKRKSQRSEAADRRTAEETARLVHELQVHQIELEMQNEELKTFRTLFENMAAASCIDELVYEDGKPVDYRVLDINPSFERIMGISRSRAVGSLTSQFYGPGKPPFFDIYVKVAETGEPAFFEGYFPLIGKHLQVTASCPAKGRFSTVFTDVTERKRTEEVLRLAHTRQKLLSDVLLVSLENTPLELKLAKVLDLLLDVPELSLERKGAIFLVEADTLVMKAQRNLSEAILAACARLPLGKCLCGRAAASGQIEFSDNLDERHEIRYDGIEPHGHYCVPIPSGDKTAGVINLYVAHGSRRDERAEQVLTAVANALSGVIERQRAAEALRDAETRYRLLFEQSPDGIVIIDPETSRLLEFNEAAHRQLGYSREEFARLRISDFEAAETPEETRAHITKVSREGRNDFETRHRTRQGEIRNMHVTAQFTMMLGRPVYHCVWRDVTASLRAEEQARQLLAKVEASREALLNVVEDQKRTEAALRESALNLRKAQEIARLGSWIYDLSGRISWSEETYRIYGVSPETFTLSAESFINLIHPDDRPAMLEWIRACAAGEQPGELELRTILPDGTVRSISGRGELICDANGKPIHMAGTAQDITERKRAEAEIRQFNTDLDRRVKDRTAQLAAANKELDAFSYSVSHDLRAPLRAINGYARILTEDYGQKLDTAGQQVLGVIRSEALRMGRLIDDLLEFARLGRQPLQVALTDMTAMAREVYEKLSGRAPERAMDFRLSPLPDAPADAALLRQVWVNLLDNALKYTRHRECAVIEVSGMAQGGEVMYVVKDNGAGFEMKYAGKLFGVFQRLHGAEEFEGTGVGLALVQRLVQRHGGRIWAEAEPDRGAVHPRVDG